jgi:hypothetical protein
MRSALKVKAPFQPIIAVWLVNCLFPARMKFKECLKSCRFPPMVGLNSVFHREFSSNIVKTAANDIVVVAFTDAKF